LHVFLLGTRNLNDAVDGAVEQEAFSVRAFEPVESLHRVFPYSERTVEKSSCIGNYEQP
jgi:hypothetical protein